jgi:formiminotetrahydrofolate cyclodeaminase
MSTLASDEPIPGGGSAAAVAAATSCNLIGMVAALTEGKKGYEQAWEEMSRIKQKMDGLSKDFLNAMDEDAQSYAAVIKAYQLPKDTEEDKTVRSKAIQDAIKIAAMTPLGIAEKASTLFDYAGLVVKNGNKNAASDGAVGALMARAAVLGALYNVKINAVSLKDESVKADLLNRAQDLEEKANTMESIILSLLTFS